MTKVKITALAAVAALVGIAVAEAGQPDWVGPYLPGVLVFKVTPEAAVELPTEGAIRFGNDAIDDFIHRVGATKVEVAYPDALPPLPGGTDITRIYYMYFPESMPVKELCWDLAKLSVVEYAEPWIIYKLFLHPNDPERDRQYGLDLCQADDAYDLSTGDPDAVIGIVDTGVDQDHSDLLANRWVNPGEDLDGNGVIDNDERNGSDDDENGHVDDFYGWDFYGNRYDDPDDEDNNPDDIYGHGTHVAGIASAVTNNRRGVASVGFSCSIMAVRAGAGVYIYYGYEGIRYAAENGAKVINCSWGGPDSTQNASNLIDYVYERYDVLVVAAAGNDTSDQRHFPAAFEHVVAVAATDENDHKVVFSNYGDWIDISAPGVYIYSTIPGGSYDYLSGTSMASPFAASVAILIRAAIPDANVDEARQLLLDGADDIDDLNRNFRGELGSGRINAFNSLNLGMQPALALDEWEIADDDNHNQQVDPGETAELIVTISNGEHGRPAEDLTVRLSTEDEWVTINDEQFHLNELVAGDLYTNDLDPFILDVSADAYPHTSSFRLSITGDPEVDYTQDFDLVIGHPDILLVDDDAGKEVESYYFNSFDSLSLGWVRWNVANDLAPDPSLMRDHKIVLWFTGDSTPALDDFDIWQLEEAVSTGANVLLTGEKIGLEDSSRAFLRSLMGARIIGEDVSALTVNGIGEGRPLAADVEMYLEEERSLTALTPVFGGDTLAVYRNVDGAITGVAAVYKLDARSHARTAFFGFPLEIVSEEISTPRHEVLQQLYSNWFTLGEETAPPDGAPLWIFLMSPASPNPFNGAVTIDFSLPFFTNHRLLIVDNQGRSLVNVSAGYRTAGSYRAVWNSGDIPSGTYFAHLVIPGQPPQTQRLVLVK